MSLYDAVRHALDAEVAKIESWRVDVLLDDLAVDEELRGRAVRSLSGGWQRTMLLARAAVIEPGLLLLDEPTNHLDLARIGVLQRFLAGLPRDCAVVRRATTAPFSTTSPTARCSCARRRARISRSPIRGRSGPWKTAMRREAGGSRTTCARSGRCASRRQS